MAVGRPTVRPIVRVVQRVSRRQLAAGASVVVVIATTIGLSVAARDSPTDDPGAAASEVASARPDPRPSAPATTTATTSTRGATRTSRRTTTSAPAPVTTLRWSTSTTSTATTSPTSTTIDGATSPATLSEGDTGPDVVELQRMLNNTTGSDLVPDGVFGPLTAAAVAEFQSHTGLEVTGEADHATRALLAELDAGRSAALPTWPIPALGNGGPDGCQVVVVGDSLMAYSSAVHADALRAIDCAPAVDAVGGRSLAWGWQCRVTRPDGSRPLLLLDEAEPGNDTCAPSGLEVLELMRDAEALGDLVVNALGTNDATLFDEERWQRNWNEALELTEGRPVVFLTTRAQTGTGPAAALDQYSAVLRRWCDAQPRCHLADWALTPAANDPASYTDSVHLTAAATAARAGFIRDAVAALFDGAPLPDPHPLPVVTTTVPPPTTAPGTTTLAPPATTVTTEPKRSAPTSTTTTTNPTSTTTTTVATSSGAPATP